MYSIAVLDVLELYCCAAQTDKVQKHLFLTRRLTFLLPKSSLCRKIQLFRFAGDLVIPSIILKG